MRISKTWFSFNLLLPAAIASPVIPPPQWPQDMDHAELALICF
jgi:hypothetical protein